MIFHDVEQNSDEWHMLRLGKPTSSNFGTFMANFGKAFGEPAKAYALRIALERVNGERAESTYTNEHMQRGHEQEPVARMLYEETRFVEVSNGGFFDWQRYGGSPDGLVGNDGVIEIKSVIDTTHYATMQRGNFDPAYKWQLVGNLDCTGREWIDFISYCAQFPQDKQLIVHRLYRDQCEDELKMLAERRAEFIKLVDEITERLAA